ncbi:MAG: rod shape-determining protein RodA, partial [Prolixibacteraceae bacterium]|nr:rod shape-determining protein RodA [Prolixibacteraceae bacterium]
MAKRNNIWGNIDWFTVILYLVLVFLGWINIYSSVYDAGHHSILDVSQRYGKQMMWIGAALGLAFIVLLIEKDFFVFFPYFIYGFIILLLIIVLFAGTEINNSKSWLTVGSFGFQPSEFGKFATGLTLAKFMSSHDFKLIRVRSIVIISAIILLPVVLIFLQHDAGSALIYFSFILVLYREGLSGVVLFFFFLAALLFLLSLIIAGQILYLILAAATLLAFLAFSPGKKPFLTVLALYPGIFLILEGLKYIT